MKQTVNIITKEEELALAETLNSLEKILNKLNEEHADENKVEYVRGCVNGAKAILDQLGIEYTSVFNPLAGI